MLLPTLMYNPFHFNEFFLIDENFKKILNQKKPFGILDIQSLMVSGDFGGNCQLASFLGREKGLE